MDENTFYKKYFGFSKIEFEEIELIPEDLVDINITQIEGSLSHISHLFKNIEIHKREDLKDLCLFMIKKEILSLKNSFAKNNQNYKTIFNVLLRRNINYSNKQSSLMMLFLAKETDRLTFESLLSENINYATSNKSALIKEDLYKFFQSFFTFLYLDVKDFNYKNILMEYANTFSTKNFTNFNYEKKDEVIFLYEFLLNKDIDLMIHLSVNKNDRLSTNIPLSILEQHKFNKEIVIQEKVLEKPKKVQKI